VVVEFSEPVQRWTGGALNVSDMPGKIFYVWQQDPNDSTKFIQVPNMFTGIQQPEVRPG